MVRYDVEVDHSRRPSLRKITEKDDTAGKTLVLCVCGVVSRGHSAARQRFTDAKTPQSADANVENPCAVVWLTDGWYAIKAQLDDPLTAMLHKGRLAVGGKLIIHGAQLVGSQEACPPLEAPDSLMLKVQEGTSLYPSVVLFIKRTRKNMLTYLYLSFRYVPTAADQYDGTLSSAFTRILGHSCFLCPVCTAVEGRLDVLTWSYSEATPYRYDLSRINVLLLI